MENESKILGKYTVVSKEDDKCIVRYNDKEYIMEIVEKTQQSGIYSSIARNLSFVSHKNISNLKIEEDENKFYLLDEHFGEEYSKLKTDFFATGESINYISLIKCYLQITEAIIYIHQKGFYHGNIKPDNILVDYSNHVYLLDFGRSYLYSMLKNEQDARFYAPEQSEANDICKESDIYSFGLCMIKLIVDNFEDFNFSEKYNCYEDLENLFLAITKDYELENIENELFLLSKQMLKEDPEKRLSLSDVQKKLKSLLLEHQETYTFAIKIQDKVLEQYRENNGIGRYQEVKSLQEKIEGCTSFWEFEEGKDGKEEIRIAIGELIFLCSAKQINEISLFCFCILEDRHAKIEHIIKYGMERDDVSFKLLQNNRQVPPGCDDVRYFKDDLYEKYKIKQKQEELEEIDRKFFKNEKILLEAESKTIKEKKNTRLAIFKEKNKGEDTVTFQFYKDKKEDMQTEEDKNSFFDVGAFLEVQEKDFKPQHKVLIENTKDSDFSLHASVVKTDSSNGTIILKLEKYEALKEFDKESVYSISYDYEVEEILWNKRNRAMRELERSDTAIHELSRKFSNPNEFIKNDLVKLDNFYDEALDENQKNAVQKAMSLAEDCELLCIQGPPGTGKTTTIVEMVKQALKLNKHDKILIASQSNQAVDNVLEKISENEDKILRIGNEEKMSEKAMSYQPEKVLNKIISENLRRIKEDPITHENEQVQNHLRELQDEFAKRLQSITSKISMLDQKDKKNRTSELASLFTGRIRVIFGTLLGISSWKDFRNIIFDLVIVDEVGRATLSELLVPCIKARKLIFVGDHKQLAPVIDDDVLEKIENKEEIKESFFQRLFEKLENADRENLKHVLTHNYRSERRICNLYSNAFYNGDLIVEEKINRHRQHEITPLFSSSVVWLDTGKLRNKGDEQKGTGKINNCNVKIIQKILKDIDDIIKEKKLNYSIGVITPYKAQKELLEQKIKQKDFKMLDIGTVDSFQGSDRDIIIYDCVRSSKEKQKAKIDFIADEKRLNVSLSRAKRLLIIVGDMDFLYKANVREKNNPFIEIIQYINEHKKEYQIEILGD